MIKDILFTGISTTPSDYSVPDGDLCVTSGLERTSIGLQPARQPKEIFRFEQGDYANVLYVHSPEGYDDVYICIADILTDGQITERVVTYFSDINTPEAREELCRFPAQETIRSCTSVGNSLVISTTESVYYALWKNEAYKFLGNSLPQLEMCKFYFRPEIIDLGEFSVRWPEDVPADADNLTISDNGAEYVEQETFQKLVNGEIDSIVMQDEKQTKTYEKVFSTLNRMRNKLEEENYFSEPFFVRAAYRLYDGSHTMQTSPTLIVPNSLGQPLCYVNVGESSSQLSPIFFAGKLGASLKFGDYGSAWNDIITHIDIFVSKPLVNYTDNAKALKQFIRSGSIESDGWVMNEDKSFSNISYAIKNLRSDWTTGYIKGVQKGKDYKIPFNYNGEQPLYMAVYNLTDTFNEQGTGLRNETLDPSEIESLIGSGAPLKAGVKVSVFKIVQFPSREHDSFYFNGNWDSWTGILFTKRTETQTTDLPPVLLELERVDGKPYNEVITESSVFYHLAEIPIKGGIAQYRYESIIEPKKNVVKDIEVQTTLSDLGQSRSPFAASYLYAFNNRLNAAVEKELIPIRESISSDTSLLGIEAEYSIIQAFIKVEQNGQTAYRDISDHVDGRVSLDDLRYFSYPISSAKQLILHVKKNKTETETETVTETETETVTEYLHYFNLTEHVGLNAAYLFNGFETITQNRTIQLTEKNQPLLRELRDASDVIFYGNKMKQSEAGNPFLFLESNTTTLPVSNIKAIASNTTAISQGQFGQVPMFAFSDDGIWALETNTDGTHYTRQPISRDVLLGNSVTLTDSAILFPTKRGIMMLSGAKTVCLSDVLYSEHGTDILSLPYMEQKIPFIAGIDNRHIDIQPFPEFMEGCQLIYDYQTQRIIAYNKDYEYAYIFDLKDTKMWTHIVGNFSSAVNSYPNTYAMGKNHNLLNLSLTDGYSSNQFLITRPLKLDAPDILKTINAVIVRGQFDEGNVKSILYGSRDLEHWRVIWSSQNHKMKGFSGTPYKYYRIAILSTLKENENITGVSVDYDIKYNTKLR